MSGTSPSRRDRELTELRDLCASGAVVRAIDLAFEHFARFGRDDAVVVLLVEAVEALPSPGRARRRLEELRAVHR